MLYLVVKYRDTRDFYAKVDLSTSFAYLKLALDQWLLQRLNCLAAAVIAGCGLCLVLQSRSVDPSLAGLALANGLVLMQDLRFAVRHLTDVEAKLNAVEPNFNSNRNRNWEAKLNAVDRVEEYATLEMEAPPHTEEDAAVEVGWPLQGRMELVAVSVRYRPGLDLVLTDVTLTIEAGEKVGVVGRTGAGKSSLILALFRLLEADQGPAPDPPRRHDLPPSS